MRVTVLGAGVIGLLSALALADEHDVRIVAERTGPATTSGRAGASFKPSLVDRTPPFGDLLERSAAELRRWDRTGLSQRRGVSRITHVEASSAPLAPGDHLHLVDDVTELHAGDGDGIPGDYRHGVRYTTWFFDVPVTMRALAAELHSAGVEVEQRRVQSLEELAVPTGADVVVNASGLGARQLAGDTAVQPVRGQTVLVDRPDHNVTSISADGFYLYPRSDGLLVGGTATAGSWDREPDPGVTELLLRGNARVLPQLLTAAPRQVAVGLRPYREGGVRLEVDRGLAVPVVHAYGHGGAGWTLGPGTALAVADRVAELGAR